MFYPITRPVVRYPGGKFKLAKWIISHFPKHDFYIEPFGGAGSVLMSKPKSRGEIYNDIDGDIVNVFRVLRDPQASKELTRLIILTPFAYDEYKKAYEPCDDPIEKARRTIFRSFATIGSDGFSRKNSGFRGLKNNTTSVTAAQEWSKYPDAIQAFLERLQNVLIESRDAKHVIKLYDRKESLFYIDPPYLSETRSSKNLYTHEMIEQDHVDLSKILHSVKGMVIISGYPSPLYDDLYSDFRKISKASTAQNGAGRTECLWLSKNIQTTLF